MATRCCSPPDSMPGRCVSRSPRPTRRSSASARGRAPPPAARRAMRSGISAFSSAVNSGSRWWNWNTNPTRRFRNATRPASVQRRAGRRHRRPLRPPSGASSPPSTCSSVLLPTPDAPTTATISPGLDLEVEVAQHLDRPVGRRVGLVEGGHRQERHAARYSTLIRGGSLTAASLVPQRLRRVEPRRPGATGRWWRRKQITSGRQHDEDEVDGLHPERHVRHLVDVHRHADQLVAVQHPASPASPPIAPTDGADRRR